MVTERIASDGGCGGFLDPPGYPTHTMRIELDCNRRPWNRGFASLETDEEWIDPAVREQARKILAAWQPPPVDSPDIVTWTRQLLGYFAGCYQSNSGSWNASDLIIDATIDPILNADRHAGVRYIRKFYPDWTPSPDDIANARWGN